MSAARDFSQDDKYLKEEGQVIFSGLQALVHIPLDQHTPKGLAFSETCGRPIDRAVQGHRQAP